MVPDPFHDAGLVEPSRLRVWVLVFWSWLRNWASALPALLAGVLVLGLGLASALQSQETLGDMYAVQANLAAKARDYSRAQIYFERLARFPSAPPNSSYGLLLSYVALGDEARAARLWDVLASPDEPGFAPAQVWRAKLVLASPGVWSSPAVALAERHLRQALRTAPDAIEANSLLSQILVATGRVAEAVPLLRRVARADPEQGLALAIAYRATGSEAEALNQAAFEQRWAEAALESEPDDFTSRLRFARATAFLGRHAKAVEILRKGHEMTKDPRYGPALAAVFADWSDTAARETTGDTARVRLLIAEGLHWDPNCMPLLIRLERVMQTGGAEAEASRRMLTDMLAAGKAGVAAHFILGVDAWLRGDTASARVHLEASARNDPRGPMIANNLAFIMVHEEKPDLERALSLADLAVDRGPGIPEFRGTRGLILTKLGRWKEALPELEAGLPANPDHVELHAGLADTYDHLGLPDLAAAHRKRSVAPPALR
jgi:tetratricopeptide (TPR) repeat protein